MLEDDHSKECGNFIAKNAQILKGVLGIYEFQDMFTID